MNLSDDIDIVIYHKNCSDGMTGAILYIKFIKNKLNSSKEQI